MCFATGSQDDRFEYLHTCYFTEFTLDFPFFFCTILSPLKNNCSRKTQKKQKQAGVFCGKEDEAGLALHVRTRHP